MTDPDEYLLGEIARRNWTVLALLVLASLAWQSISFTAGVLSGGLVAIGGYLWLQRSLKRVLEEQSGHAARRFKKGYLLRLGSLAAILALLIIVAKVHPVGLAIGLSVVVVNILWTTVKRFTQ